MVTVPFELVENILFRLPVKPLKRFRCVAKSWRSLIDSETFVKDHLKMSLKTNSHRHLIVAGGNKGLFYKVDLDNDAKIVASVVKLPVSSATGISNSCNGLFVVSGEPVVLWNPFTKECRNLPRIVDVNFPVPAGCYSNIVCGIVWDSRNDDYKVVRVEEHRNMDLGSLIVASRAHIFGLKWNSWRRTGNFTYAVKKWETDVNGALHTLIFDFSEAGLDPCPYQIKAFSVESERHYDVKLPPLGDIWANGAVSMFVYKLGGCLALNYTNEAEIAIWVMKHYGVRSSWTKTLSIPMKPSMKELEDDRMKPLVYSNDGHKVLVCFGHSTFFWQDVRDQSIGSVLIKGLPRETSYVEACVESLVSFRSEPVHKQVNDQDMEKDTKKIRKNRDDFLSMGFKLTL